MKKDKLTRAEKKYVKENKNTYNAQQRKMTAFNVSDKAKYLPKPEIKSDTSFLTKVLETAASKVDHSNETPVQHAEHNYDGMSFGQAFNAARKAGLQQFTYKGKPFTTQLATEVNPASAPQASTAVQPTPTPTPQRVGANMGGKSTYLNNKPNFGGYHWTQTIPSSVTPQYLGANMGGQSSYLNNKPNFGGYDWTQAQLPTYYTPTNNASKLINPGITNQETLLKALGIFTPGEGLPKRQEGGKLEKLREIAKHQQGGAIENVNNQYGSEELYADFAVRLLKRLGANENEIMVGDQINPQYQGLILESLQEVDNPEFWEIYSQDPDGIMNQYIQNKNAEGEIEEPEVEVEDEPNDIDIEETSDVELAKKGARLKKLRKMKGKSKKRC